ncbi:MAG: RIP metalloprotease RseP [Planctomycetota bacterium]|nr:MAG: RIP metalloprotease RseP [Planctomycetota bacterium]
MDTVVSFLSSTWNIILTIMAFSFIIFVHELGHYIMAVRAGVKVDKFYVGFDFGGLKIFSFNHKGTEYGIGVFPFGGYVKLYGMEELPGHEMEISEFSNEHFQSKTISERFGIMAGGVAMNFISAVLLIFIMYGIGKEYDVPIIGTVRGTPAIKAGLKENDKILELDGEKIKRFLDIHKVIVLSDPGKPLIMKIERGGVEKIISITPKMDYLRGMPSIGVTSQDSLIIASLVFDSPLLKAGVQLGDEIIRINGIKINYSYEFQKEVDANVGKDISISVNRDNKEIMLTFRPEPVKTYRSGLRNEAPVEISCVHPGSSAEKGMIREWDLIKSINGVEIKSYEELLESLKSTSGQAVDMQVMRKGELVNLNVKPTFDEKAQKYLLGISIDFSGNLESIREVEHNGPLHIAGLRSGDKIVSIAGNSVSTIPQLVNSLEGHYGKSVDISYLKKDDDSGKIFKSKIQLRYPGKPGIFTRLYHKSNVLVSGDGYIYDRFGMGVKFNRKFILAQPKPDSIAAASGFKVGDRLEEISYVHFLDGKKKTFPAEKIYRGWSSLDDHFKEFSNIYKYGKQYKGKVFDPKKHVVDVKFIRDGEVMSATISSKEIVVHDKGFSGVGYFANKKVLVKYSSIQEAFSLCYDEVVFILDMTAVTLGKLVVGKISTDTMSGPIGISTAMYHFSKSGYIELIWLVAMMSINIGFLNFLPFPPLDGGALFFLFIEKIKGSPVSANFQIVVSNLGVVLLLSLMFFVTVTDISRFFG